MADVLDFVWHLSWLLLFTWAVFFFPCIIFDYFTDFVGLYPRIMRFWRKEREGEFVYPVPENARRLETFWLKSLSVSQRMLAVRFIALNVEELDVGNWYGISQAQELLKEVEENLRYGNEMPVHLAIRIGEDERCLARLVQQSEKPKMKVIAFLEKLEGSDLRHVKRPPGVTTRAIQCAVWSLTFWLGIAMLLLAGSICMNL